MSLLLHEVINPKKNWLDAKNALQLHVQLQKIIGSQYLDYETKWGAVRIWLKTQQPEIVVTAKQIKYEFELDIAKKQAAYRSAIKIKYSKTKFVVDAVYNRLERVFGGLYLPDEWRGGKAIQNCDQNVFYQFFFVNILGAKQIKEGNYLLIKKNGALNSEEKTLWIVNSDSVLKVDKELVSEVSALNPTPLDKEPYSLFETYLNVVAVRQFSQAKLNEWISKKQIFEIF